MMRSYVIFMLCNGYISGLCCYCCPKNSPVVESGVGDVTKFQTSFDDSTEALGGNLPDPEEAGDTSGENDTNAQIAENLSPRSEVMPKPEEVGESEQPEQNSDQSDTAANELIVGDSVALSDATKDWTVYPVKSFQMLWTTNKDSFNENPIKFSEFFSYPCILGILQKPNGERIWVVRSYDAANNGYTVDLDTIPQADKDLPVYPQVSRHPKEWYFRQNKSTLGQFINSAKEYGLLELPTLHGNTKLLLIKHERGGKQILIRKKTISVDRTRYDAAPSQPEFIRRMDEYFAQTDWTQKILNITDRRSLNFVERELAVYPIEGLLNPQIIKQYSLRENKSTLGEFCDSGHKYGLLEIPTYNPNGIRLALIKHDIKTGEILCRKFDDITRKWVTVTSEQSSDWLEELQRIYGKWKKLDGTELESAFFWFDGHPMHICYLNINFIENLVYLQDCKAIKEQENTARHLCFAYKNESGDVVLSDFINEEVYNICGEDRLSMLRKNGLVNTFPNLNDMKIAFGKLLLHPTKKGIEDGVRAIIHEQSLAGQSYESMLTLKQYDDVHNNHKNLMLAVLCKQNPDGSIHPFFGIVQLSGGNVFAIDYDKVKWPDEKEDFLKLTAAPFKKSLDSLGADFLTFCKDLSPDLMQEMNDWLAIIA